MPRHFPALYTVPAKAIIGRRQETWELLVTYRASEGNPIPAGCCVGAEVYTVPDGKVLYLGGGVISCNASCIQKVVMCHTPGIIGDYRYDMQGQIVLNPLAATIIEPGDTITIYTFNNDEVSRDFSIALVGMLVRL